MQNFSLMGHFLSVNPCSFVPALKGNVCKISVKIEPTLCHIVPKLCPISLINAFCICHIIG